MYFIITDTHMGHANIRKYCNRPDDFEKLVLARWKERVTYSDVIIHLGDLSFEESWVRKVGTLPGKKLLLRGNHDRLSANTYIKNGWMLFESFVLRLDGIRMIFSHRPMLGHSYDINIHGHQHDLHVLDDSRLYFPVALEHSCYAPVALDRDFLGKIRKSVDQNRQLSPEEIRSMLGSDRELDDRDFYGGFGKESFERSKERLKKGYEVLDKVSSASMGYLRLDLLSSFVEGKLEFEEFESRVNEFVR